MGIARVGGPGATVRDMQVNLVPAARFSPAGRRNAFAIALRSKTTPLNLQMSRVERSRNPIGGYVIFRQVP